MKKTLITILLLMVVAISTRIETSELITQGMTNTESQNLDFSHFNCQIDFEFIIGELARWVDIIYNRQQLIKDLAIINQVVSIVEKAKDENQKPLKKQVKKIVTIDIVHEIVGNKKYVALDNEIEGEIKENDDEQQNQ